MGESEPEKPKENSAAAAPAAQTAAAPAPVAPAAVDAEEQRVPSPSFEPRAPGAMHRFLLPARELEHAKHGHATYPWYNVLWLTGVDYFSSLGYQPGIAFLAAGALAPSATVVLVIVTLLGALPVYAQVARRSYAGQGSIAMLERLLPGWTGKLMVLVLLGFAATDFVITMTLSASDAAQHAVENPLLHSALGPHQMLVTCALLLVLAAVFLRGFTEAIGVAVLVGVPYLALNVVVIVAGAIQVFQHPELAHAWSGALAVKGSPTALLFASLLIFPKLALGMSGFETGVSVMPLVRGAKGDGQPPAGRIANTKRLLVTAAVIMSVLLIGSSLVTTILIPASEFADGGKASGRALAFLGHELLGHGFGTVYDVSTILILWFAGASAMAGLMNLIPRYLPRFGMAPSWVQYSRPLVLIILGVDLFVTWVFKANVDAQGGAYATGVLVLMLSAAIAVALSLWREARQPAVGPSRFPGQSLYFWVVSAVFTYTLVDNIVERPDGVYIATLFTLAIILASAASRYARASELRVEELHFVDAESEALWHEMSGKKVNLVPLKATDAKRLRAKARHVRRYYHSEGPAAFLHVGLNDDRSEFESHLRARVYKEEDSYVIDIEGAVAIANVIAWVSEQIDPIAIYLQLSLENPFRQNFRYLLWGEGETGILVYEVLVKYWHFTPEDDVRPYIFLVSE
jgi:hypothetical protein